MNEFEILEKNAKGQTDKVIMVIAIIALIGTVICFINLQQRLSKNRIPYQQDHLQNKL